MVTLAEEEPVRLASPWLRHRPANTAHGTPTAALGSPVFACPGLTMSCSAATVSSSAISASATISVSCTRSGPELVAGAKRAGAIGAARPRFAPMLSGKNHCRPASIHLGCGARCSAIGGGALGAAWCCRSAPSHALAALDGGPGGSEGSRDFDDEASEPSEFLDVVCTFCTW